MGATYRRSLDSALGALPWVEFTTQGSEVLDFAVILLFETEKRMETVRVYDGARGRDEMHRYTRSGAGAGYGVSQRYPWRRNARCDFRGRTRISRDD